MMTIFKYLFKFIWWVWCIPGSFIIHNAYITVRAKDLNDIQDLVRTEREMNKINILAPLYSIPLWVAIIALLYAARHP